ncbi:MAG: hypothetical protein WCA29_13350 [Jiangellales bacterium]
MAAGLVATTSQAEDGSTYLRLSTTPTTASFSYESADQVAVQDVSIKNNCVATADGSLVTLTATGGDLGFRDAGFGVRAKGPGTNCGQISGSQQAVSLKLGPQLDGKVIAQAEVDIESKFSCSMTAAYKLEGEHLGTEVIDLSSLSDCGPDSGSSDNYRVTLPAPDGVLIGTLFDEVTFSAAGTSAISVEGGAESSDRGPLGTVLDTNDSIFELVDFNGIDCLESDDSVTGLTFTRTDEKTDDCRLIPYSLSREGNTIDLIKNVGTQTEATFTLEVSDWDPEPAEYPVPATTIDYTPDSDATDPVDMVMCGGTPGEPTLPLDVDGGETDLNTATPITDGWCVVSSFATIVGNGDMQVTEVLYGKGDPRFNRF